jgi:Rieske 2Fe-2S family protein
MSEYVKQRAPTDVTQHTLPARYYTDPAHYLRELERIHFEMWLYAGRTEELPGPGSYVVRAFANANVIILRDDQAELRAFHNVCRHRGTKLCAEPQGTFDARIQCKYHAWTYRLDGTLANAPHMDQVQGFCEADFPLSPVHLAVFDGHIFLSFSDRPMPFDTFLAGVDKKFANWRMHELKTVERKTYLLHANWKLVIQNYHECLHCPIAHPQLNRQSHYLSGDNEPAQPTYLGAYMELREGFRTLSVDDHPRRRPFPGLTEEEKTRVYYYAILPNMLLNPHPDYVVTFRMNPLAVDKTEIVCEWLMHPDELARPGFDPSDAIEFWHITNLQDWELSDLAQAGISSRGYQPGPYSNREELLSAFDRWILERTG